jgi:hypothetical protein
LRHVAYAGGWKKFEPLWDVAIRAGQVLHLLPFLEAILAGFGEQPERSTQRSLPPETEVRTAATADARAV